MEELIREYREQIAVLEQRLQELQALGKQKPKEGYLQLLRRIGTIQVEILDLHFAISCMEK